MGFDTAQYLDLFREEAAGYLAQLNQGVLDLERGGQSPEERAEIVKGVFRAAHSLKGTARMLDLADIAAVAHALEDLLDDVRAGRSAVTPPLVDALLAGVDTLEALTAATRDPEQAAGLAAQAVAALGATRAAQPSALSTPAPAPAPALSPDFPAEPSTTAPQAAEAPEHAPATGTLATHPARSSPPHAAHVAAARVSVPVERLDHVLRLAAQIMARAHDSAGSETSLLAEELYHEASRARMVPVDSLFRGFQRAVRDAERSLGKGIDLVLEGEDTELDKRLLDGLHDPLMHLVRNAMDHGIEEPETRAARGKPARGTVRLTARPHGERVLIEVADDGHGLDPQRFRDTALRRGLLTPDAAAHLSDDEAVALMFRPGFSTREEVSAVSGRGVGMDVVKTLVNALEGQIQVSSAVGQGTSFCLSLPLSVAAMRVLLVRVQGAGGAAAEQTYALPAGAVERCEWLAPGTVQMVEGKPCALLDDRPVPLRSLAGLLGAPSPHLEGPAVLVRDGPLQVLLAVGDLVGEALLVVEPLGRLARGVRSVSGAALLPDGTLVPVLSPAYLVDAPPERPSLSAAPRGAPAVRPRVLVVDDVLLTRELERSVLAGAGYDVEVASDGQQALERLADLTRPPFDALVADVEMPRLGGLDLVRALRAGRAGARCADLPVVMLSGLESAADRAAGLAAGAQAYLAKSAFDQATLTETLAAVLARPAEHG